MSAPFATKPKGAAAGLRRIVRVVSAVALIAAGDPVGQLDFTRPQHEFLHCAARFKLFRTGNQLGKSTVGLAECVLIATGRHPRQRFEPPCEIWILFASRTQSLPLQAKLAKLLPPGALHPDQKVYNPVTGFGHHEPVVRFANGSIIRIKTINQGGIGIAGGSPHHILVDEPPTPRVYEECKMRLRATGGTLSMTLTPINRPCDFLKEATVKGELEDKHFTLTAENLVQMRSGRPRCTEDGVEMDAAWVAIERERPSPHEAPILNDGEWETRAVDRQFGAFVSTPGVKGTHVLRPEDGDVPVDVDLVLCIGADHGTTVGNQAGVLVAVDRRGAEGWPRVYVLEESLSETRTTSEHDARELLAMLARRGWTWHDVDHAFGDIPTGSRGDAARKGNRDIEDAIRRDLGLRRSDLRPRIMVVKQGAGSGAGAWDRGERWMHQQMVRGNFFVSTKCPKLIECFERYDGTKTSPYKHLVDAVRYALKKVIDDNGRRRAGPKLRV